MDTDMLLGMRIKGLRTAQGYTPDEAAQRLGVTGEEYSLIEGGDVRITLEVMQKAASVLGVTVGDITSAVSDVPQGQRDGQVKEMLDLFYANKHLYRKLKARELQKGN